MPLCSNSSLTLTEEDEDGNGGWRKWWVSVVELRCFHSVLVTFSCRIHLNISLHKFLVSLQGWWGWCRERGITCQSKYRFLLKSQQVNSPSLTNHRPFEQAKPAAPRAAAQNGKAKKGTNAAKNQVTSTSLTSLVWMSREVSDVMILTQAKASKEKGKKAKTPPTPKVPLTPPEVKARLMEMVKKVGVLHLLICNCLVLCGVTWNDSLFRELCYLKSSPSLRTCSSTTLESQMPRWAANSSVCLCSLIL